MSKIFQHGSHGTLYAGFYEGTISLDEVMKHGGDIGIGTLNGANGEVVILDGRAYHIDMESRICLVRDTDTLPYVALIDHTADLSFEKDQLSSEDLSPLTENFGLGYAAYSVKVEANFKSIKVSCKNKENTGSYAETLKTQAYFTYENVHGTLVGLWSPKIYESLYGDGFHLHFLGDDTLCAGHLVSFEAEQAKIELGVIESMTQELPIENTNFQKLK